jgi:hypothetical protein
VVQLGLLQLVPELAALCPDAGKRTALLAAHKAYLQDSHSSLAAPPASMRGWVPPEAALAALAVAEAQGSWACERCTLTNAPSSRACEVCCAPRPKAGQPQPSAAAVAAAGGSSGAPAASTWTAAAAAGSSSSNQAAQPSRQQPKQQASPQRPAPPPAAAESWPTLAGGGGSSSSSGGGAPPQQEQAGSSAASSSSSAQQAGKKNKKPAKQPLAELLASGQSHPQNAWSQQQRKGAVTAAQPAAPKGDWKGGGGAKLANKINNTDEAWGKRQK